MENKKAKVKVVSFQKEYADLMKGYVPVPSPNAWQHTQQWGRPSDYIPKFSIYPEAPNSVASAGTVSIVE